MFTGGNLTKKTKSLYFNEKKIKFNYKSASFKRWVELALMLVNAVITNIFLYVVGNTGASNISKIEN